ncbi:hypothetical protein [Desulfitobacterium metallireducens]|uniref:Uncharacterized protein n=1 Tax=Desulfitobacterium metallireducens DSM 15288 TaxID=871968 RepID=W0ECL7_9FIRM|nr:hypothetical protein [Desulfitobacterium metallireducens]AHF08620.1 hypothetical protein DESME_09745 [Desulfitobacterium metallireducens DSM 15288]
MLPAINEQHLAIDEQHLLAQIMNRDLIYTELQKEFQTAQALVSEVKTLSAELLETLNTLKDETENRYLKFEDLPDYVDIKILKTYLKVGTNRIYELTNTSGFPTHVPYANGKKVYAKADVIEWLEHKERSLKGKDKS